MSEEVVELFELEMLKCRDCGLEFDVSQVKSWKCPVCGNPVWIIATVDERGYVLERVRARDVEKDAVVLIDGSHNAYEVEKTKKGEGRSFEIYLKKHDILKVKGDFVNTIIGEWKPGTDGKPSFKILREKPKVLIK